MFENFSESSTLEYGLEPLFSDPLPRYPWKNGLKFALVKLDFIHSIELLLLLENNISVGVSSVSLVRFTGDRNVESGVGKI